MKNLYEVCLIMYDLLVIMYDHDFLMKYYVFDDIQLNYLLKGKKFILKSLFIISKYKIENALIIQGFN